MENLEILITEEEIQERIKDLAKELYQVYGDEEVVFVCTLKGAVFFTCDLLKRYPGDARMEFVRASSYEGDRSTGKVELNYSISEEKVKDKHVVVIEDIVDTGYTLAFLKKYIANMKPKTLKICALLDKPSRRVADINADYVGFEIADKFVIGYGLDYNQKYRNLPYIGEKVKTKTKKPSN